jgi:hypothetical protein
MSDYDIHRTDYSPESNNDFDEPIENRSTSPLVDENNIIMKTPQSLDDLLDIDDRDNQNEDEQLDNENDNVDDDDDNDDDDDDDNDDDDDSTHLSIDDAKTTNKARQKKSIAKHGKPHSIVE